jgi:hypothetical protein
MSGVITETFNEGRLCYSRMKPGVFLMKEKALQSIFV